MEENKVTYKLDILNVDGTPPQEMRIEKHGDVVRFTLSDIENADKINRKNIKELTAKRTYEAAVMTNIENNNKYGQEVKEMPDEKRYVVHMYQESFAMVKAIDAKLAELQKAVDETVEEVAEIKRQIPEVAPIPSPFVSQGVKVGTLDELSIDTKNPMFKIVQKSDHEFGIKEVDEGGSTVGMREETFGTEVAAQEFVDSLGGGNTTAPEASTDAPADPAPEATPASDAPADATNGESDPNVADPEASTETPAEPTPEGEATPE